MRDIALQIARESKGDPRHALREYLQNYLLFLMQKTKMTESLFFVGGTALRFLYGIRRYSEDLDFTAGKGWVIASSKHFMRKIDRELERAGYDMTISSKDDKTVQRMMFRFAGLLFELGFSGRRNENFSIHLEIDLNPPLGWKEERSVVNIYLPVLVRHYDLPSAFAGKLAAILLRPYTKGRDIFDLFWFKSRWPDLKPNLTLLNNALKQQRSGLELLEEGNWLAVVRREIESLDWRSVEEDVLPFLESEDDLITFSRDAILTLLT